MSSKRAAKRSWDIDSGSWDIDTPIGVNFSPGSKRLSVRVIQKYLRNGFLEQRVHHHGNCGRIVCKEKQTGRLRLPPIDCLPRLELIGHPISKEETTVSPITDRRNKLARVVECHAPNAPKLKTDIHVVSSPSSREQADHMKMRLLMDSRYFGNEQASEAIEEIGTLWDVWNEDAALCCQIIDEIPKHICFDKKPPWKVRHNDTWQFIRTLIDMHYAIRVHFFTKMEGELRIEWNDFFASERCHSYTDFCEELRRRVHDASYTARTQWPLEICQLLLNHSDKWTKFLLDQPKMTHFLDSIASLQALLISLTIQQNYQEVVEKLSLLAPAPALRLKVMVDESVVGGGIDISALLGELLKMGEGIPRAETKLYPRLFPHLKYIAVSVCHQHEEIVVQTPTVFESVIQRLSELRAGWERYQSDGYEVGQWKTLMLQMNELRLSVLSKPALYRSRQFLFDFSEFRKALIVQIDSHIGALIDSARSYALDAANRVHQLFLTSCAKLHNKSQTEQMTVISEVIDVDLRQMKSTVNALHEALFAVIEYRALNDADMERCFYVSRLPSRLSYIAGLVWHRLYVDRTIIEKKILEQSDKMNFEAEMLEKELNIAQNKYRSSNTLSDLKRVSHKFADLHEKCVRIAGDYPVLKSQLALFDLESIRCDLPTLLHHATLFKRFSALHLQIVICEENWLTSRIVDFNKLEIPKKVEKMRNEFTELHAIIEKEENESIFDLLHQREERLEKTLTNFVELLPVLTALSNEGLKEHHWQEILGGTRTGEETKLTMRVKDLIEINVAEKAEKIEEVSAVASKELVLEENIKLMRQQWTNRMLTFAPYKNTDMELAVLTDQLRVLLETHIVRTQTILASPFVASLMNIVLEWSDTLGSIDLFFSLYSRCESKWCYLEPIFTSEEVAYQMPNEWQAFKNISESWSAVNQQLKEHPIIMRITSEIPSIHDTLQRLVTSFERMHEGFEKFLDKKRITFPRLYFLSDTELMDLLSHARNASAVSMFLPRLFSSIRAFELTARGEIGALLSDTECLQLIKPVSVALAKRHVEKWLSDVEKEMKRTLRWRLKEIVEELQLELIPIMRILKRPSQIVIIYYKLSTTNAIEMALRQRSLRSLQSLIDERIAECLSLMNLPTNEVNTARIALLHFIQCKEMVERLSSFGDNDLALSEWSKETRYYWSNGNVFVRMLMFSMPYEYEFLSVSDLTIATRHTKKIITQLMMSERYGYSGLVAGPAATGKSHSIKELSRLFGRFFVMFNCSTEIPNKQITALIKGCVLSGSTLCFDEFNRLSPHSLTTAVTSMLAVHKAADRGESRLQLDGNEVTINSAFAIHVTMNPNLIERSSLPINVDSAFRRVTVDAPDCDQIALALLQMNNIRKYDIVSRMIIALLCESSVLIGRQLHLDFGLRAMRAIVASCVMDRRSSNEIATAAKAVRTILSPAFTPAENSTFSQLLKSITKVDEVSRSDAIRNAAIGAIAAKSMTSDEMFVEKCCQLYELLSLRNAVLVFGESMCGKSMLIDVVAEMTRTEERPVIVTKINPSLVDAKALFGHFDTELLEWIPGIFSSVLERTLLKADNIHQWIVLDGKAHSKWIESMNSLLDDNRTLCLANGQTIVLRENVRVIFETDDLEFVAESTISRCGVVNMNPTVVAADSLTLISSNDESDDGVKLMEKNETETSQLKEIITLLEISDPFRKKLLITRINVLLKIWANVERNRQFQVMVVYIAAHCIVGVEDLRGKLLRTDENVLTIFNRFPRAEVDWLDLSQSTSASTDIPTGFQILLVERLVRFGNPVLLCGPSHTGKSSLWKAFLAQLDPNRWNVAILHLSSLVDSICLLKSILHSRLVRIGGGHYTGAEGKSTLFVLVGMDRLRGAVENSAVELLREIFEENYVVVNATDEIRFSDVHFIGEFTTNDEEQSITNKLAARLQRHWFPLWVDYQGRTSIWKICERITSNYSSQFVDANTELFEEVIKAEFARAVKCSPPVLSPKDLAVCEHWSSICKEDQFVMGGLPHGPLVGLMTLKADLIQKQNELEATTLASVTISGHSSRHIALLMKVLHSDSGHCILIGDEDLGQQGICELVAVMSGYIFDSAREEATLQQWNDLLLKTIRSCIADNSRHVLFIKNSFYNDGTRNAVLSDLNEVINNGGLPMRIFNADVIEELIEKISFISPSQETTKWEYYSRICENVSKNLHIVLSSSRNSFDQINSEYPNFLRYSVVDHYGGWSYEDKVDIATAYLRQCPELTEQQVSAFCEQILKVHSFMPTFGIQSTSSSFLNLIQAFRFLLKRRVEKIEKHQKRYKLGLEKLLHAEEQMAYLQSELARLQPELVRTSAETSMLMSKIEQETIEVENAREVVAADENRANAAATNAQTLKSESEQEVADAIPALESAVDALQTMNQRDISVLKSMRFPPQGVRLCMEAVCILLGETPIKVTDPLGGVKLDYWLKGQKVLSDIHFLSRIRNFDKDNVSKRTIDIIRNNYLSKDEFDPEAVRQSSLAAEGLCLWVKAIDAYHTIATVVAPKREKLKKAELLVKKQMKQLDARRKALQEVTEQLQSLSDSFSHMSQRKQDLLTQIQICEQRMSRTQRLIAALGGEKERWEAKASELDDELVQCPRYSLLAAIAIEYLSAFSPKNRQGVLDKIRELLNIETPFTLWRICDEERPSENAIIIENTRRVPLIIESRGEAKSFLMELTGGRLIVVDASDKRLAGIIRDGISAGSAILIESLIESLPVSIMPVLELHVFKSNNQQFVTLDGKRLPYNSSFRLYLSTEKPQSGFSGAFLSKVIPIEYKPNEEIISAELWRVLITYITPQHQKRSAQLHEEEIRLGREIMATEEILLAMLANANDLDDERATHLLSESKKLTIQRESIIHELNDVNERIEWTKRDYRSIIDAVVRNVGIIVSLKHLLPAYHFSLAYLLELFDKSLHLSAISQEDISAANIMKFSLSCFDSICSSLFEEHRHILHFLLHSNFTDQQLTKVNWQSLDVRNDDVILAYDIWKIHLTSDCRTPIALLVPSRSLSVVGLLEQLARSTKKRTQSKEKAETILHVYSVMDIDCVEIDTALESGDWLLLDNAHLASPAHIRATDELLLKIKKAESVNQSFRIFFAIAPDSQPQPFLDHCLLIAFDIPKKMPDFIRHYYSNGRASEINETLDTEEKRAQLYRLCLLHFAIRQRCQYGIHGWSRPYEVGDLELQLALSLYQELSLTEKEISLESLRAKVLDVVYLSKIDNAFDARVFAVLYEWIFIGVNKYDDALIRKLLPKAFRNKDIIRHTRSVNIDTYALSGLHENVEKYYKKRRLQKLAERVHAMFGTKENEDIEVFSGEVPSKECIEEAELNGSLITQCIRRELIAYQRSFLYQRRQTYLRSLLSQSTINAIDVSQLERPAAVLSALRLEYSAKQGITFDEVVCVGRLSDPLDSENKYIKFLGCVLLGCRYDENVDQISELTSEDVHQKLKGVWIRADRRTNVPDERVAITLHDRGTLDAIMEVRVSSTIPATHWMLRGARILTFTPT